jgi:hypothetical protein
MLRPLKPWQYSRKATKPEGFIRVALVIQSIREFPPTPATGPGKPKALRFSTTNALTTAVHADC